MTRTIEAKKYARLLLGCYRTGDANDPEVYIAAIVAVLSRYPVEIMRVVCDPNEGMPAKVKWLPSVSEVRDECERLHDYDRRMAERQRRIDAQIAERAALPAPKKPQNRPRGKIVTFGEVEAMADGKKVKIYGVFDKDRQTPYRG